MTIKFERNSQCFMVDDSNYDIPSLPITITLQVNRNCNLSCVYCSETAMIATPNLETIYTMIDKLRGVDRIIVSGGEPTLREDIFQILEKCRQSCEIVALASNAIRIDAETASRLKQFVDYVDVTIDGTRNIHNAMRGHYDKVIKGMWNLTCEKVETSVVMVLTKNNRNTVSFVAHTADLFGAKKLKILSPIPKGKGATIMNKRLSSGDLVELFEQLKFDKKRFGWNVRITITDWHSIREGHAILVHPNGDVVASPVWSHDGCVAFIGNLLNEELIDIWTRYPYKMHHVDKYLEKTLMVC